MPPKKAADKDAKARAKAKAEKVKQVGLVMVGMPT